MPVELVLVSFWFKFRMIKKAGFEWEKLFLIILILNIF